MDVSPAEFVVKCMTWYIAVCDAATRMWHTLVALWRACSGVFSDKRYVIFDGRPGHAYDLSTVSPWATGSAVPAWRYNDTQREFQPWDHTQEGGRTRSLPFLSMEILSGSRVHYDVTEYISGIRVRGGVSPPQISDLLAAWAVSSQIVLHPTRFTVRVITEMGDTEHYTIGGEKLAEDTDSNPVEEETKDE